MSRFWAKVERGADDECWNWTAARIRQNWHGVIRNGDRNVLAHRLSWEIHNGPIPDGHIIHHECRNPACVNPAHLTPMTSAAHCLITVENPRIAAHHAGTCLKGHQVDGDNVEFYFYKGKHRKRCKICGTAQRRRSMAAYKARQRALRDATEIAQ